MKISVVLRFLALGVLWLLLCYMLLASGKPITLYTWFVVIASAVIIFVPMYKKYIRNNRK